MAIRNQAAYDLGESRPWPISDEASAVADDGVRLPSQLLADLHISFPDDVAQRAFISAVTVTPTLATVTILGTDSAIAGSSFVPLAAISLPKPFDPYRMQALEPLYPGVGGWIVFGREAAEVNEAVDPVYAKFSTPAQSVLAPSTAKAYRGLPVASFGRLGEADPLTGIIRLSGGGDLEIVKECREIPLVPGTGCDPNISTALDVIVIRLKDRVVEVLGDLAPAASNLDRSRNVFDLYRGPCTDRPESISCGDPQPIELLASVPPDCCGNIDLVLRGCAEISRITEQALVVGDVVASVEQTCGVIIDCGLGLAEACITPDRLPAADGTLPNEYDDLCESLSSISITLPNLPPDVEQSFSIIEESESASAAGAPTLPICDNFAAGSSLVVNSGRWTLQPDRNGRQVWSTNDNFAPSLRSVSTYPEDWNTFYKRAYTRVVLLPGDSSTGVLHNAALIANYRETALGSGRYAYYLAEIDYDGHYEGYKLFRIAKFNGQSWNTEFAVPVSSLALQQRYDIFLSIYPAGNDAAWLEARLVGVDNPAIDITIGPLLENNFGEANGRFGVAANRSIINVHHFCIENTVDAGATPPTTEP